MKIDSVEMANGNEVETKLGGAGKGHPWITVLDSKGNELANSDGPGGNIGCPVSEDEQAYFISMLERTVQHSSADDVAAIATQLKEFAKTLQ